MKKQATVVRILLLVTLLLITVVSTGLAQADYSIMTANSSEVGQYLVDGQGKTLYYFTKDAPGVSNCKGQCAVIWPPFFSAKIDVPPSLDATDFDSFVREDGMKQTTFKGWPLYYFNKDMVAGDMKGQRINDVWFIVNVK